MDGFDLRMPRLSDAESRRIARDVAKMLGRNTPGYAMGPKARANRAKPTGTAKMRENMALNDVCKSCGGPSDCSVHARGPWGREAWVKYCRGCGVPSGWTPIPQAHRFRTFAAGVTS